MVELDRILVSTSWEARFPLCRATSLVRVGSDHSPILFDSVENMTRKVGRFFFFFL